MCRIHQNNVISNISKKMDVTNLVEGTASDVVAGLKLSHENFIISLNLQKKRVFLSVNGSVRARRVQSR